MPCRLILTLDHHEGLFIYDECKVEVSHRRMEVVEHTRTRLCVTSSIGKSLLQRPNHITLNPKGTVPIVFAEPNEGSLNHFVHRGRHMGGARWRQQRE